MSTGDSNGAGVPPGFPGMGFPGMPGMPGMNMEALQQFLQVRRTHSRA